MAAGILPAPGTAQGPCLDCAHVDCAATRGMAESLCVLCQHPIGYSTPFHIHGNAITEFVHERCYDEQLDRQRGLV